MRRLLPLLLLLAACGKAGPDAVRAADALYADGRWEQAAAAYQELPEDSATWRAYGAWRSAAIYRDALKDTDRAEAAFQDCAKEWAETDWGYTCQVELGDLVRDLGRPRAAIDAYRKGVELRPRGRHAEHCLLESGRAYISIGEPAQARVEWDELARTFSRSPLLPMVAVEAARAYDLEGLHEEALAGYREAQKQWPTHSSNPLAVYGEAEALEQLGRLSEARETFERALQVHPNPDAVRLKLERLRARESRKEQKTTNVPDSGRRYPWR
jgi:tetratricopeptide (TPR) repeat protein